MKKPAKAPPATPPAARRRPLLAEQWKARVLALLTGGARALDDSSLPPPRRIQKGRQATKAARALLRIAPPGLKRQARGIRVVLSGVRRLLADTRDTDALLEAFEAVRGKADISKRDTLVLRRILIRRRAALDARQADDAFRAMAVLGRAIRQIEGWPLPRGVRGAVLSAIGSDFRRMRRETRKAFAHMDIELLHDLRKHVIAHRHQIEFMAGLAPAAKDQERFMARVRAAKDLHEALGDHRDLHLLDAWLRPMQEPKLYKAVSRLLEAIDREQEGKLKEARRLADGLTGTSRRKIEARLLRAITR